MNRKELAEYIASAYGSEGGHPFNDDNDTTVFRHEVNKKWFALVMNIPAEKLGLPAGRRLDIVNLKCSPALIGPIRKDKGIFPAWHMNKSHWISAALDGSADDETLRFLIDLSYDLTKPKMKKARVQD